MAQIELKPLTHREAVEYFRSKGFAPQLQRFHHLDHFREDHARNWVVAKAMKDDISRAIREEFDRALSEGRTLAQFQADLQPRLEQLGWWGKSLERDPLTGELQEVQLGSMRRLRTIFDTNMRTSHAAGHWARIQRTKVAFPYLEYVQIERPTKRHDHARFHGKIWRVDDPIWLRIYPPNGYFCGCTVHQLTEGQMQRAGKSVSPAMDLEEEPWINKRSGETFKVPKGVNPGFDSNPGATWLDLGQDWDRITPDLTAEQRTSQRAIIEGLRLRRLSDGRETVVVTDAEARPVGMQTADAVSPDRILLDRIEVPSQASILHSHVSDSSLSVQDVNALFNESAASITAISPGGSIWRAVRGNEPPRLAILRYRENAVGAFATLAAMDAQQAQIVYQHAMMLWLERQGVITYHFRMSERVRQILAVHSDLLERLAP